MASVAPSCEFNRAGVWPLDRRVDSLDLLLANPSWFGQPIPSDLAETTQSSLPETPWDATPSAPNSCREALARGVASVGRLGSVNRSVFATKAGTSGADLPVCQASSDSLQHKQSINRAAQRKFRQRKKERAQATEAELSSTVAQIAELRAKQQLLQARNQLLEQQQRLKATGLQEQPEYDACMTAAGPGIVTSIYGSQETLLTEEASTMQLPHFASLWTEYAKELAQLLVKLGDLAQPDTQLQQRLQQVTIESSQLMGVIKSLNVDVYKAVLQNGVAPPLPDGQLGLTDDWYSGSERMLGITEKQAQDLLYLRKLYLTQRGLLAAERAAMTLDMRNSDPQHSSPAAQLDRFEGLSNLDQLSDLSSRLKANAAADYAAYLKIACAVRRGVVTTEQWAAMIVHAYPHFPSLETWLEMLARQHNEPDSRVVLAAAQANPLVAEWAALDDYMVHITQAYCPDYVPVPRCQLPPVTHQLPRAAFPPVSLHDMLL